MLVEEEGWLVWGLVVGWLVWGELCQWSAPWYPPTPAWGAWYSTVRGGGVGQSVTAAGLGWLPGMSAPSAPAEEPSCSASAASQR